VDVTNSESLLKLSDFRSTSVKELLMAMFLASLNLRKSILV
jgi:hypothetical protein